MSIGAGFTSKAILLVAALYTQANRLLGFRPIPFTCTVKGDTGTAGMRFLGTLDEMHALVEIFKNLDYDPHSKLPVSRALDLGANIGIASMWLLLRYPGVKLDSYEPNAEVFALLKENLAPFPNARVFQEAVAEHSGELVFHQSRRSFASSLIAANDSSEVRVKTVTLDEAIERIGGIDLLKIDIEGAEAGVFSSTRALSSIPLIVGETHGFLCDTLSSTHTFEGKDGTRGPFLAHLRSLEAASV